MRKLREPMCKPHQYRYVCFGCESTKVIAAIEISVRKIAPSPPWSRKAHCLRFAWEIALSTLWSGMSHRLRIGLLPLFSVLIDSLNRNFRNFLTLSCVDYS